MSWTSRRFITSRLLLCAAIGCSSFACVKAPDKALLGPVDFSGGGALVACAPELTARAVPARPLAILIESEEQGGTACR